MARSHGLARDGFVAVVEPPDRLISVCSMHQTTSCLVELGSLVEGSRERALVPGPRTQVAGLCLHFFDLRFIPSHEQLTVSTQLKRLPDYQGLNKLFAPNQF